MFLCIFLIVLILVLFIIFISIIYLEIPHYWNLHYKKWPHVKKLDKLYGSKPRVNIKGKVVVSLTTIPDRIDKMGPTLCSILTQTKRVDEIRINVPYRSMKGDKYNIPDGLKGLKYVKIYRVKKDLGPATKVLPTAADENPHTKIIVVDDDNLYGSKLVENLVKVFKARKEKDVITNYGSNIDTGSARRIYDFYKGGNKHVDVLFGCGGYILTPSMLPPGVYNYDDAPKDVFYVDDNWISGWLSLNNVKIYLMGMRYGCTFFPSLKCFGTISLSDGTNKSKRHEKITNRWFIKKGAY